MSTTRKAVRPEEAVRPPNKSAGEAKAECPSAPAYQAGHHNWHTVAVLKRDGDGVRAERQQCKYCSATQIIELMAP